MAIPLLLARALVYLTDYEWHVHVRGGDHLFLYLDEQTFRFNKRKHKQGDAGRFRHVTRTLMGGDSRTKYLIVKADGSQGRALISMTQPRVESPAVDLRKTLTELEGSDWGEPDYPSNLVVSCHQMRNKPIGDLTNGELRMAIGQQFSLPILVPIALERLQNNPLVEGYFYEGDLLKVILSVEADFWLIHPNLWREAKQVGEQGLQRSHMMDDSWQRTIKPLILSSFEMFSARVPK